MPDLRFALHEDPPDCVPARPLQAEAVDGVAARAGSLTRPQHAELEGHTVQRDLGGPGVVLPQRREETVTNYCCQNEVVF